MIQYNPSGIFEQNPSKGGVCTIKTFGLSIPAGTTGTLINLSTDKIFLITHLNISAYTADNTFQLDSKPAGAATILMDGWVKYKTDIYYPQSEFGIIRTLVNGALRCTISASSIVNVYGQYIEYTP